MRIRRHKLIQVRGICAAAFSQVYFVPSGGCGCGGSAEGEQCPCRL